MLTDRDILPARQIECRGKADGHFVGQEKRVFDKKGAEMPLVLLAALGMLPLVEHTFASVQAVSGLVTAASSRGGSAAIEHCC